MIEILGYSALIAIVWFFGGVAIVITVDRRLKGGLETIAVMATIVVVWSVACLSALLLTIGYILGSAA
jgi:hypothetical protein